MAEPKDSFEAGKAALRSIKTSLTSGAAEVGENIRRAAGDAADTAEDMVDTVREHGRRAAHAVKAGAAAARDDIRDATADVREHLDEGVEEVVEEFDDGMDDAAERFHDAAYASHEAWAQARDAVREASREAIAAAEARFNHAQSSVKDYVRAKPLGALGIAAAVGFAAALLLRRRR